VIYFVLGGVLGALALWWNWPLLAALAQIQPG
jgi:hypothetical protein